MRINPAPLSKINWTQAIGLIATIGTVFGLDIPQDMQLKIVTGIGTIMPLLTIVFRTFFTEK